jgi:histone deacetylase 11
VFPQFVIQRKVLEPMLYQTGGTVIAGQLALIHGWAINLGGVRAALLRHLYDRTRRD